MKRIDAKLDEKFERLGDKLRNELFVELKHAIDHFNTKVGTIKQFLLGFVGVKEGMKSLEIMEVTSLEKIHRTKHTSSQLTS